MPKAEAAAERNAGSVMVVRRLPRPEPIRSRFGGQVDPRDEEVVLPGTEAGHWPLIAVAAAPALPPPRAAERGGADVGTSADAMKCSMDEDDPAHGVAAVPRAATS